MTNKLYPKNVEGIQNILTLINKLNDHNTAFYSGTIDYMTKQHPPYKSSLIYYHPEQNMFKFIKRGIKLLQLPVLKWEKYSPGHPCFLREAEFCYLSVMPFIIIVDSADWLLEKREYKDMVTYIYDYIKSHVSQERIAWKKFLIEEPMETKKLF
jgi:hypothetical protein